MKITYNLHVILQLFFVLVQTLVPAFVTSLTPEQKLAIGLCIGGMQTALGLKALGQDPDGNPLKLSLVNRKRLWGSSIKESAPASGTQITQE